MDNPNWLQRKRRFLILSYFCVLSLGLVLVFVNRVYVRNTQSFREKLSVQIETNLGCRTELSFLQMGLIKWKTPKVSLDFPWADFSLDRVEGNLSLASFFMKYFEGKVAFCEQIRVSWKGKITQGNLSSFENFELFDQLKIKTLSFKNIAAKKKAEVFFKNIELAWKAKELTVQTEWEVRSNLQLELDAVKIKLVKGYDHWKWAVLNQQNEVIIELSPQWVEASNSWKIFYVGKSPKSGELLSQVTADFFEKIGSDSIRIEFIELSSLEITQKI